jgi:hypothetical protein
MAIVLVVAFMVRIMRAEEVDEAERAETVVSD